MITNKFVSFLFVALLVMVGAVVWLLTRLIVPIKPINPYFPDNFERISEIHWIIGQYQPVYLYSFENKGDLYIKTVHRDSKNRIKLMNVYLGNKNNLQAGLAPLFSEPLTAGSKVESLDDYRKHLKFGQRFLVSYIRSASRRPGTGSEDAAKFTDAVAVEYCKIYQGVCEAAGYTVSDSDSFWEFKETGELSSKLKLRALGIHLDLVK